MSSHLTKSACARVLPLLAMAFAMPAWAQLTAPALVLSDGTNTVSVDATGTVTMTPANCCVSTSVVLSAGSITWSGTIGNFTVVNANGRTKPFAGLESAPTIDLGVGTVIAGSGGTLTITWGDVGFTGLGTMELTQTTTIAGGSATFTGYVDGTNALFGKGTTVGNIPNVTSGGSSSVMGPGVSSQPFSLTVVDTLNLQAGAFFTSDSQVLGTQYAPLTITCPTASSILGSAYSSSVTASGGVPPYSFSLTGNLPPGFTFNNSTGAITGTDSAATNTYNFAITVTDSVGNSATTGTGGCNIVVTPKTPLSVACPTATTGEVGAAYTSSLVATGGIPAYTFSTNPAVFIPGLSLNSATGAISGQPSSSGTFTFTAQVQDSNGNTAANTATANCTATITPPPTVNCSTSATATTGEVGVPFTTPALSGSGGTSPYTYTLNGSPLPGGISTVNSSNGVVSGTPTGTGSFNVGLKDAAGVVAANSCPYTVIAAPTVTCAAVTSGEVGAAFNAPSLTVTGGTAPYVFSVASGTLPAGLTLNTSTGAITGTPTAAGTFSLKVTDADGAVVTVSCPYTIVSGPTLSCSAVSGEVGQGITSAAPTVSGGTAPFTFAVASGAIPAGLSLNSSTGSVTGTATAAGSFTLKVTDANGVSASGSCPFTISAAPVLTCSANNQLTIGVAYNGPALTVTGGIAPYTFSVGGTLPAGLTLNASTGAITGTPTATGSFSIHVTDALGATTSTCAYTVNPGGNTGQGTLSAKCASTTAQVGAAYNSSIVASGGSGSYTYAVVTGSLPNGLTLNASTGAITGTPTAAGTVGFSIQVTDTLSKATTIATCATSCGVTITSPSVTYVPLTSYYNVWAAWSDGSSPQHGGLDCYGYGYSLSANAVPISGGTTPLSTFLTPNAPSAVTSITIPLNGSATSLSFLASAQYGAQTNQPFVVTYTDGSSQTFTQSLSDWGSSQGFSGESVWESFPYRLNPQGQQQAGPWNIYQYTFTLNSAKSLKSITLPNNHCVDVYRVWTSTLSNNVSLSSYYNAYGVVTTGSTPANGGLNGSGWAFDGDAVPSFCGQQLRNVCPKDVPDVVQAKGQAITLTGNATSITFLASSVCGTQANQTFTVTYTDGTTTTFTTNIDGTSSYSGSNGQTCWGAYSSSGVKINQYTFTLNSAKTLKSFTLPNNQCVDILQVQLANATSTVGDCSITVAPAPPKVTCGSCSGSSSTTQVGQSYSSQLDVSSGVAPFTFRITSGSLPAGLTLNATTGVVSGKPTQPGTYTFTTTVTDSTGATATATCTIVVQGCPITVTCGSCLTKTNVQVGESYSSGLQISGGSGSYQVKVIAGAIPAGLTMNPSNGAITGTLTTAGDWYFQTQVTDNWGDVAVTTCSINVVAPIHLDPGTCTQQNVGKCGQTYKAQPNCNGGTGGYQFSICKGYSLPWGLDLDPNTGIISGKPNLPCNQTVAIQVCDSAGHTTTTNCTIAATK